RLVRPDLDLGRLGSLRGLAAAIAGPAGGDPGEADDVALRQLGDVLHHRALAPRHVGRTVAAPAIDLLADRIGAGLVAAPAHLVPQRVEHRVRGFAIGALGVVARLVRLSGLGPDVPARVRQRAQLLAQLAQHLLGAADLLELAARLVG